MRNHRTRMKPAVTIGAAALVMCLAPGCAVEVPEEAPDPVASEQPAATESEPASDPADPRAATIDLQSYTVTLPEPLASEYSFDVQRGSGTPGTQWIGDVVDVVSKETGCALFFVACYSDDWGPQGMLYVKKLGASSAFEGTSVYLCQARMDASGERVPDETDTYATYVAPR